MTMDLPLPDPIAVITHARPMAQRFKRAAWISLCFVALLAWIKLFEHWMGQPFSGLALRPHVIAGLIGVLTAPLLHGSLDHLASNALPLLILGTLAGGLYPRATVRALPLIWIGSGVGAWFLGEPGSAHIGASGIATGLLFFVFLLAVLRWDRQAIAAGMMAFFLYGGMVVAIFPREANISWEMHMSGAICGVLAALLWRKRDAALPRKRYSWEDEPEEEGIDDGASAHADALTHELPRGTAEEAWIESDADGGLDLDDAPDAARGSRRRGPAPPRRLH
jgi:membrane associated rhomboid family serine protease